LDLLETCICGSESETIGTYDYPRMESDIVAYCGVIGQAYSRIEEAVLTNRDVSPHEYVAYQLAILSYLGPFANIAERTYTGRFGQLRLGANDGTRMGTNWDDALDRVEQVDNVSECEIRTDVSQDWCVLTRRVLVQDQRSGLSSLNMFGILGIGDKTDIIGAGRFNRRGSRYHYLAIAVQFGIDPDGNFG
jgi:hypothetical protein